MKEINKKSLQIKCAALSEAQRLLIEDLISDAQIAHELTGNDIYSEFARLANESPKLSNAARRVANGMIKAKLLLGVSEVLHTVNMERLKTVEKHKKLGQDMEKYFSLKKWQKILNSTWYEKRKWLDTLTLRIYQVSNGVCEKSGNIVLAIRDFKKTGKDKLESISDLTLKEFSQFEELTKFLETI